MVHYSFLCRFAPAKKLNLGIEELNSMTKEN
jgi:hypothetical protein